MAKVKPTLVEWDGEGSPVAWVISRKPDPPSPHLQPAGRHRLDLLPMLEEGSQGTPRQSLRAKSWLSRQLRQREGQRDRRPDHQNEHGVCGGGEGNQQNGTGTHRESRDGDLSIPDAKRLADMPKEKRGNCCGRSTGRATTGRYSGSGRPFGTPKCLKPVHRTAQGKKEPGQATTLIHGDCREEIEGDCLPQRGRRHHRPAVPRSPSPRRILSPDFGKEWHSMMEEVVIECRRVLKPKGIAVFILQPNAEQMGKMRLWLWRFVVWAGRIGILLKTPTGGIQLPSRARGAKREYGLMRPSVKCASGSGRRLLSQSG